MVNKVLLARLLGPESFGVYILFLRICEIAGMVSLLGTKTAVVKLVGITAGDKQWARLKGTLLRIFQITAVSTALITMLIIVVKQPLSITVFKSPELFQVITLCILVIPLQNGLTLVNEIFRGLQNMKATALLPVVQQAALLALLAALILSSVAFFFSVLLAYTAGIFIALAVGAVLLMRRARGWAGLEKVKTSGILAESLPMMVTSGTLMIMSSTDVYVLGIFTNPSEVGVYGAVYSLASMTIFSLGVISQVIPGMIAHYNAQQDFKALSYVVRYASTLGTVFSIPLFLVLLLFGRFILVLLFGGEYGGGATALVFLVLCQFFRSLTGSCGYVMQMTGMHLSFMTISLVSGLVNLVLNIALVKSFGKDGVAAATAFSLVLQNILAVAVVYKRTGLWTFASPAMSREIVVAAKNRLLSMYWNK